MVCFAKKGFKGTTVEDIATAAGLSRPPIDKHFGDKEGLIDAVLEAGLEEWLACNSGSFEGCETASAALKAKLSSAVEFAEEHPILQAILRQDPRVLFSGHWASFRDINARSREATLGIIRSGLETGEFRSEPY